MSHIFYVQRREPSVTKATMGHLGLSRSHLRHDNIFRRLFWPSNHAGEADILGEQGLWICVLVAFISCAVLGFDGQYLAALLTLVFFVLGGIGVREHNIPTAILIVVAHLLNMTANAMYGLAPGIFSIAAAILLLANIRSTWIANRWAEYRDPEIFYETVEENWRERLVDQIPALVWPKARIVFFSVAGIYLLLLLLGIITRLGH